MFFYLSLWKAKRSIFTSPLMMISIITINLNNKLGLQKTMESVLSQTSNNYEWIVIDGGSTDGSKELIEQNAQHIAYWVSEQDKGIYNAMNKGIEVARGEYLEFLNSGDYLTNNHIVEKFCALNFTKDVVYGDVIFVNKDGEEKYRFNTPKSIRLSYFWSHRLNHQASFFHKRCFINYRYNEENKIASDLELYMHLVLSNSSFCKWDCYVVFMEIGGISSQDNGNSEFASIVNRLLPEGIKEDYKEMIQWRDVDLAIMIKSIIRSNKFMRNLTRVFLYPIYFLCKK